MSTPPLSSAASSSAPPTGTPAALPDQELTFRAVLDTMADGMYVLGGQGELLFATPKMAKEAGLTEEGLDLPGVRDALDSLGYGDEHGDPLPVDSLAPLRVLAGEADRINQVVTFFDPLTDEMTYTQIKARALRSDGEHLNMIVTLHEDITAEREAEHAAQETARTLQAALLPPDLPVVPGLDVGVAYRLAEDGAVGGDFYDVFELRDGRWMAVIGDVCGKGAEAAALTALCRYTIHTAANYEPGPAAVLGALNESALSNHAERFATVAAATLRRNGHGFDIVLALGGHPQPLLVDTDGSVRPIGEPGMVVGAFGGLDVAEEVRFLLEPGQSLLFFTDGLSEAHNARGEEFDLTRYLSDAHGHSARLTAAALLEAARTFRVNGDDDMAVLLLRVPPVRASRRRRFDCSSDVLSEVREFVASCGCGIAAELVVTELATNAIRHAESDWMEVTITESDRTRVELTHPGLPFTAQAHEPATDTPGGRGFLLIESLSEHWGIDFGDGLIHAWVQLRPEEAL